MLTGKRYRHSRPEMSAVASGRGCVKLQPSGFSLHVRFEHLGKRTPNSAKECI